MKTPDIIIATAGISLIYGMTKRGIKWIKDNVEFEEWQLYCEAVACEPTMAADIFQGATSEGLAVEIK